MCGITGLLDPHHRWRADEREHLVNAMTATLTHRGPDSGGVWTDVEQGLSIGHRRLAIVDLSPLGAQPMVSHSGRTVVSFNGQVYNHQEIRRRLTRAGVQFRGGSDTEVLVEAIDAWGLRRTLDEVNAMFALAVWDRSRSVLTLARDRLGEKPLYYTIDDGWVAFASEIRALRVLPEVARDVDPTAVASYFHWSFVPHPQTIWSGVAQLAPGTLVEIAAQPEFVVHHECWWSLETVEKNGQQARQGSIPKDSADRLESLLSDSVRIRMTSDVPLGAFLSGGIDSSLIAALAQQHSTRSLRTFTVRMPDIGFDESASAAAVADHLGTEHHLVDLTEHDALEMVPRLSAIYDEPFADPSMLPTALLCREVRSMLTVSLSGDGGDEAFGGYNRHVHGADVWRRSRRLPGPVRRLIGSTLLRAGPATIDRGARMLPGRFQVPNFGDKLQKVALVMGSGEEQIWERLASTWPRSELPLQRAGAPPPVAAIDLSPVESMLWLDTKIVLPDQMLTKVDRASMAVGLEVRVPFLDHRVIEWAWSLPLDAKIRDGLGKRVVRDVLHRMVPPAIVDRPKMGFDPPIATWLRGPLRPWAEEMLAPSRLADDGWIDANVVGRHWSEHLSGTRNWDYRLWSVLMFSSWLEGQKTGA